MVFIFGICNEKTLCIYTYTRYDFRIKYFNLKKTRSQNALALEDVQRIWIPFLVFDNTENNEATKVIIQSMHIPSKNIKILYELKPSQILAGFLTLRMSSAWSGVNTV